MIRGSQQTPLQYDPYRFDVADGRSYANIGLPSDQNARNAGPEGSPERAAALKDLVAKYGGDPDLIDHLLEIRGADASESAWAIKENIVAQNARKAGHDAVVALEDHPPRPTAADREASRLREGRGRRR
jgi:hypothetical protein